MEMYNYHNHRERKRDLQERREYVKRTYVGIPEGWGSALLVTAKTTKQSRMRMEAMALNNRRRKKRTCPFIQQYTMPIGGTCRNVRSLIVMLLALNLVNVNQVGQLPVRN
jgi:hypothetical protein